MVVSKHMQIEAMSTDIPNKTAPSMPYAAKPKRPPAEYSKGWARLLVALDFTGFFLSAAFALMTVLKLDVAYLRPERIVITAGIVVLVWLALFQRVGLYRRSFALSIKDEFYCTISALALGVLPLLLIFTFVPSISSSRIVLVLSFAYAVLLVGSARTVTHLLLNNIERQRPRRIVIVGRGDRIDAAADALNFVPGTALLRLPVESIDSTLHGIDLTQDRDLEHIEWLREARLWGCDTLLLTEMLPPYVIPHLLEVAARERMKVAFAPPRVQTHAYSLSLQRDGSQALIVPSRLRACTPGALMVKRALDIVLASAALVVFAIPMLLIALAVMLDSGSPVLYRQTRVGLSGKLFDILKFRSMPVDAEKQSGPVWTVQNGTKRTTRIGGFLRRTSLDELPQLFNVLRGDMSVVGPRPERPIFVEQFRRQLPRYDERHLVRPGITGWSHIQMKRNHDQSQLGERLAYDLFYLEHWSLFMDISVVVKTAAEVFFHKAS
jgi:exopolysaccharide biosynthesis polyprenyl glycosylphosphotransferase